MNYINIILNLEGHGILFISGCLSFFFFPDRQAEASFNGIPIQPPLITNTLELRTGSIWFHNEYGLNQIKYPMI